MTASRRRGDDFSLPAGNSRRRRRLKKPGAPAPGFTGVWGRLAPNKHAPGIYRRIACHYQHIIYSINRRRFPSFLQKLKANCLNSAFSYCSALFQYGVRFSSELLCGNVFPRFGMIERDRKSCRYRPACRPGTPDSRCAQNGFR